MAKKGSRARRKAPEAAAPELEPASEVGAPAVQAETQQLAGHVEAPVLSPPSAEALAAHDSFVRSPSAVVESLGIRVASAVVHRLASIPPPPAAPSEDA